MYRVQFLNNEKFETLPAKDIHTKLGVYYPETEEVFVRDTGVPVLDVFTALHEVQHAHGDSLGEHFDAENKCYYKDFGNALGLVGSVLGNAIMPGAGTAIGGGLGSLGASMFGQGQKAPQQQQSQGFMPGIMSQFSGSQGMQGPTAPNVMQAQGAGAAGGMGQGGSMGPGASNVKQFQNSQNVGA